MYLFMVYLTVFFKVT